MAGWMDDDSESAQLIFSLQVSQCEDFGPLCPLLTLYRGTQSMFGSLVPMGSASKIENRSTIHVQVKVEDNTGASVVAVRKLVNTCQYTLHKHISLPWCLLKSYHSFKVLFWHLLQEPDSGVEWTSHNREVEEQEPIRVQGFTSTRQPAGYHTVFYCPDQST